MPRGPGRGADARALAALAALVVAALAAAALRGQALVARDLVDYSYPRLEVLGAALARGEVPRWNPWAHHGCAWFGPRAGGVLYPPNLLFGWLAPARAMALFVGLHLLLAAEGARRLAGRDAPGAPALAAGVAYGLGSLVVALHGVTPYLASAALLPWVLAAARRAARAPAAGAAGVAVGLGLVLLAVEVQGALGAAGAALALAALEGGQAAALTPAPGGGRRGAARAAGAAALGVALAGALGATTVLSVLDEAPRTDRALGVDDARYRVGAAGLLLDLAVDGALGQDAQDDDGYWGADLLGDAPGQTPWATLSVGAVGLALAAAGAAAGGGAARAPLALVVAGAALAFGRAGEALALRFPAKWLVLTALGLAWLVGLGLRAIVRGAGDAARARGAGAARAALGVVVVAAAGVGALAALAPAERLWSADHAPFVDEAAARGAMGGAAARAGAVALLALGVLAARARARLGPAQARAALLGLLALELVLAAQARVTTAAPALLDRPPLVDALRAGAALGPPRYEGARARVLRAGRPPPRPGLTARAQVLAFQAALLVPGTGARWGVRSVDAFESVAPRELARLAGDPRFRALPRALRLALVDGALSLERAGVRAPLLEPVVAPAPGVVLVRDVACPAWAYLVGGAVGAPDEAAALARVVDPERDPTALAVLGPEGAGAAGPQGERADAPPGRVVAADLASERVALEVEAARPAWLVVRETFHPDWAAAVDGAPAPTARADLLFRAVRVPAGRHRVTFTYAPWWWGPALGLTALGGLGVVALAVVARRRGPAALDAA